MGCSMLASVGHQPHECSNGTTMTIESHQEIPRESLHDFNMRSNQGGDAPRSPLFQIPGRERILQLAVVAFDIGEDVLAKVHPLAFIALGFERFGFDA